ncbi:MAG: HK97 family phage prohead protease [Thermaurantimonas sp.]|uniref:HK97 family phage prohead protease n=1 Tax=Thermaurantimonas TaxID=2681566 RepID=UPI0023F2D20B|nr:HK97 family phage prohead protease [Thermaurantimonas aggregans]MCX8149223.1 HK97 family phage prohead protease [Thermaurantimonas aggregans]
MTLEFVLTDETVNRYGYRILVDGIDTSNFEKNPVCLLNHDTQAVSLGKWRDLKKVGDKGQRRLVGTLEFDPDDEKAVQLYRKYHNGFMRAVSISLIPIEESDEKHLLLPGQKHPTVTKSELVEVSLVSVPGQSNAVRLITPEHTTYTLKFLNTSHMKQDQQKEQDQISLDELKRERAEYLIEKYGLEHLQPEEKNALLMLALNDYQNTKVLLEVLNPAKQKAKQASLLVELHAKRLQLSPEEKELYTKAAMLDYEATRKKLESMQSRQLQSFIDSLAPNEVKSDDRSKWTLLDWYKNDLAGLVEMSKNEPEKFKQLEADFKQKNRLL